MSVEELFEPQHPADEGRPGPTQSPQQAVLRPTRSGATAAAVTRLGRAACVVSALALMLGEVAGSHWPFVCLTPFVPQWTALAAVGLLLLVPRLVLRRFSRLDAGFALVAVPAVAFGVCATIGLISWRMIPPAHRGMAINNDFGRVKILSANVQVSNPDHRTLLRVIDDEDPDIVFLPELSNAWLADLAPLRAKYPIHNAMPDSNGAFGSGLWSRLPGRVTWTIFKDKPDADPEYDVPQADATLTLIDKAGRPHAIRFIGLHPLPPIRPHHAAARDAVLDGVRRGVVDQLQVPTIVAGDLNATRYCDAAIGLAAQAALADATAPLRWSWPNTWSWPVTGIRIDHVLVSQHWHVLDVHAGRDIHSDHLPIVATLQLAHDEK